MRPATQPNVVLIHCHDLGRWLPVYGMPHVPAPSIAEFAQRAVVFENAHSAAPLCSPARGSLFTGLSPYVNGVQGLVHRAWRYREGVRTAPELLRDLGYRSALIGLQHENVDPTVLGFDQVVGLGYLPRTGQVVETARNWLSQLPSAKTTHPIFLTIGTWEVHRPWPAEDYRPADPDAVDVPGYLPDNDHTREDIAAFYGSIRQFDEGFRQLIEAIDKALDPSNTMIVFTTDHGAPFPRAKSTLYDAGTGVSLIIRPPAAWAIPPRRINSIVSHLDLVPTLLDAAGGMPDSELEGTSLLPLLSNDSWPEERVIFTAKSYHDTYDPKRAARSIEFAYIRNYEEGPQLQLPGDLEASITRSGMSDSYLKARLPEELYDRRNDPNELDNVVHQEKYQAVVDEYRGLLQDWLHRTGDPIEQQAIEPAPPRSRAVDALAPLLS